MLSILHLACEKACFRKLLICDIDAEEVNDKSDFCVAIHCKCSSAYHL